jgi:hypothetical protein
MQRPTILEPGDVRFEAIRERLKLICSHPEAIEVSISGNAATLAGAALENEVHKIESAVRSVPGIDEIHNELSLLYSTPERAPGTRDQMILRGGSKKDSVWTPTQLSDRLRVLLGISGACLMYYGVRKRDLAGLLASGIGLGALVRAVTNLDTVRLFEMTLHPKVSLYRELEIDAPIEVAFNFWSHFENYPRFMSYVKAVQVNDQGGFTWTMEGPAGVPIRWDSQIKEMIPCQLISWESCPDALMINQGAISFRSLKKGCATRLQVQLSYAPPGGALGWEAIRILGFDPRAKIDSDLLIMKALIEEKKK